jgi:hypothetical protein
MKAFYASFIKTGLSAKALVEAKRAFWESPIPAYRHPYFWAPFVPTQSVGSRPSPNRPHTMQQRFEGRATQLPNYLFRTW